MKSTFAEKILRNVPPHIKPIDYLMDNLDLGRESAYRRMRGEIPFTLDEISILSHKLDFSIDEMLNENKRNNLIFDMLIEDKTPVKNFINNLQRYSNVFAHLKKDDASKIITSQNRISVSFFILNELMLKFFYYRYLYSTNNLPAGQTLTDLIIPPELADFRDEFIARTSNIAENTVMLNRNYFLSICREIQYYYNHNLLTIDETNVMKTALFNLIKDMQDTIIIGYDNRGIKHNYYLSLLDIGANTVNISYRENIVSMFFIYSSNFILTRNSELCKQHKNWLEIMKKHSVLISQSNELFQMKFFEQQRQFINTITDSLVYF
ncbi:MAG: hypothetical protein LBN95_05590 [Prevotellaceae bacterium]|jgi:hypothetical protein|nr:hypothetical protein [Prevotellaceae bacterium]